MNMKERAHSEMVDDKKNEDDDMMLGCSRLERLCKDMNELWEQIKQPCSFRKGLILLSLSILSVFQSSSATVSGQHNNDLNMISNCSVPLNNCPTARELIAFREQCIHGFELDVCVAGSSYLCGIVDGYIIETCAVNLECWPGTFFNFVFKNGLVTVECVPCPGDTFETEHTKTSTSSHILGCTYRHIPQDDISSNLVLYENGTHATPSRYRCKTEEGFYDEYGHKFCDDIPTHRCKCIFKYCQPGYQLYPTGHCRRCKKKLRPETDWRCEDYVSFESASTKKYNNDKSTISGALSSDGAARSMHLSSNLRTNTNQDGIPVTDPSRYMSPSSTDSVQTDSDKTTLTVGIVLGVLAAAIIFFLVVFLFLTFKNRSKTVRHEEYIQPTVTYHDKRVTNIEVTKVYSNDGNMLLGDGSKMINMESTPDCDSEDNDTDQTDKKMVI